MAAQDTKQLVDARGSLVNFLVLGVNKFLSDYVGDNGTFDRDDAVRNPCSNHRAPDADDGMELYGWVGVQFRDGSQ